MKPLKNIRIWDLFSCFYRMLGYGFRRSLLIYCNSYSSSFLYCYHLINKEYNKCSHFIPHFTWWRWRSWNVQYSHAEVKKGSKTSVIKNSNFQKLAHQKQQLSGRWNMTLFLLWFVFLLLFKGLLLKLVLLFCFVYRLPSVFYFHYLLFSSHLVLLFFVRLIADHSLSVFLVVSLICLSRFSQSTGSSFFIFFSV